MEYLHLPLDSVINNKKIGLLFPLDFIIEIYKNKPLCTSFKKKKFIETKQQFKLRMPLDMKSFFFSFKTNVTHNAWTTYKTSLSLANNK